MQASATATAFDAVEIFESASPPEEEDGEERPRPEEGADDQWEDNDTPETATELRSGSFDLVGMDLDWFVMNTQSSGAIVLEITGSEGDLDLAIFDDRLDFENPLAFSAEAGSNERLEIEVPAGRYFAVVLPYEGQGGHYTLTSVVPDGAEPEPDDDGFEENDTPETATELRSGRLDMVGVDLDWFVMNTPTSGTIALEITGSEGDLDLAIFDSGLDFANPLAMSADVGSNERIEIEVPAGRYFAVVLPY